MDTTNLIAYGSMILSILGIALSLIGIIGLGFILLIQPSFSLLKNSIYHDRPWPGWNAIKELFRLFNLYFHTKDKRNLFKLTRLRIELELLNPRPAKPILGERKEEWKKWKIHTKEWRKNIKINLENQDDPINPIIKIETCSSLYKAENSIKRYFLALSEIKPSEKTGFFFSKIKIDHGFVAPIYLLTGLLHQYDDDWKRIIEKFQHTSARSNENNPYYINNSLNDNEDWPNNLWSLQSFLFNCWLIWGPSIPVCTCNSWNTGIIMLQYGYGDENNSILVYKKKDLSLSLNDMVAREVRVTGRILWVPSAFKDKSDICCSQQTICSDKNGRMALELDTITSIAPTISDNHQRRYYSAYLWVMLIVCDEKNKPIFPLVDTGRGETWRGLIPIFEHGNIADNYTYEVLKNQLALKALSLVNRIFNDAPNSTFRIGYACAFDDSSCGRKPLYQNSTRTIRDILAELTNSFGLSEEFKIRFLINNHKSFLPSCRLPKVMEEFYEYTNLE